MATVLASFIPPYVLDIPVSVLLQLHDFIVVFSVFNFILLDELSNVGSLNVHALKIETQNKN